MDETSPLKRGILAERRLAALAFSLLLIPAILGTNLIYDGLNHGPNRIFLETPLDRALPVVPVFAIPVRLAHPLHRGEPRRVPVLPRARLSVRGDHDDRRLVRQLRVLLLPAVVHRAARRSPVPIRSPR